MVLETIAHWNILAVLHGGLGQVRHPRPVLLHRLQQRLALLLVLGSVEVVGQQLDPLE